MNLVETYINSQPLGYYIEAQKTVTDNKSSQTEIQNPVTISNGRWFKLRKRNLLISLRCRNSTAGVRMSAMNSENINNCFDLIEEVFREC